MLLHELLYFLNAAGSRISNMTFSPPCVMKVISMHFSEFALHFIILDYLTERTVLLWTTFFRQHLFPNELEHRPKKINELGIRPECYLRLATYFL